MADAIAVTPQPINRGAITACVILAVIMQALDTTIANVALPYMQGSVSASSDQINWVLTSYIVAAAIMTPPSGFLANRFGRKRVLMVAVVGFVVASVLCGIAQSLVQIVAFRLLQGFFGAALVPLSQSILLDIYPPEERGSASTKEAMPWVRLKLRLRTVKISAASTSLDFRHWGRAVFRSCGKTAG